MKNNRLEYFLEIETLIDAISIKNRQKELEDKFKVIFLGFWYPSDGKILGKFVCANEWDFLDMVEYLENQNISCTCDDYYYCYN